MESLDAPAHLFTTSGNPVCCAASLATLQVIEDEHLVEKSATDGAYAKQAFKKNAGAVCVYWGCADVWPEWRY